MSDRSPTASIIIPCYNSRLGIGDCLRSLAKQELPSEISTETIVVDSSNDETAEIVRTAFPWAKLVKRQQQTLPGKARNCGVAEAEGEILAFIDSDCVADESWLATAIECLEQGFDMVGGAVVNGNPVNLVSIADHLLTFGEVLPGMPRREGQFMPSCNLVCTRQTFEALGGFPPNFAASEDTVFVHSARKRFRLLFEPRIRVAHHNRTTFGAFLRHHLNFGLHSALVRRKVDLPGSWLARNRLVALLAPPIRLVRVSTRIPALDDRGILRTLLASPLILAGAAAWSWGFVRGAWARARV